MPVRVLGEGTSQKESGQHGDTLGRDRESEKD